MREHPFVRDQCPLACAHIHGRFLVLTSSLTRWLTNEKGQKQKGYLGFQAAMRVHHPFRPARCPARVNDHRRLILNLLPDPLVNPPLQELDEGPLRVSGQQTNPILSSVHVQKRGLPVKGVLQRVWGLDGWEREKGDGRFLDEGFKGLVEVLGGQDCGDALSREKHGTWAFGLNLNC
jgi:hypothetical protein